MSTDLRPTSLATYVGQRDVVQHLQNAIAAARAGGWQLDHFLFAGMPGLGKTSLARAVAAELGARIHLTTGPAIEHRGQLAALLTTLGEGDVLFIDEIHRLPPGVAEVLYTAMEDARIDLFAGKKAISVKLPRFTLLAATTAPEALPRPLVDRFGHVWHLHPYDAADLTTIVNRAASRLGMKITHGAAEEVARRSRGTPRVALRLLRRLRDTLPSVRAATTHPADPIWEPEAVRALDTLGIDRQGLEAVDRAYLEIVTTQGPIGVDAIAAALGQTRTAVEGTIEPYLIQAGHVRRTPKGRVVTAKRLRAIG